MPYLPIDLDAKKLMPKVAGATGTTQGAVLWGLMELWEYVWNSKRDVVTGLEITGCFSGHSGMTEALVVFGFLEAMEDGRFRVRGAQRFLNVSTPSERGALGGKKSAANGRSLMNLRQFASDENTKATEATPKQPPKQNRSNTEALSPNTQHPTPKLLKDSLASLAPVVANEDPRPSQMLDAWNAAASGRIPKARATDDRTPKLRRWLEKRGLEKRGLEEWKVLVARINASPFLRGERGDFKATIDWALKPSNATKTLDGNYDDHSGAGPPAEVAPDPCSQPGCDFAAKFDLQLGSRQERVCETHFYQLWKPDQPQPRAAS